MSTYMLFRADLEYKQIATLIVLNVDSDDIITLIRTCHLAEKASKRFREIKV